MRKSSRIPVFCLLLSTLAFAPLWSQEVRGPERSKAGEGGLVVGEWLPLGNEPVTVTAAMTETERHGTIQLVRGTIVDVCQKRGCWMVVSDGTSRMRITFKDYGFFVPTDSDGQNVLVQGIVSVQEIPEDLAKHYAGESAGEDPDEIEGSQQVITMVASGVRFE